MNKFTALFALCFASMGTFLFALEKPAAPAPVGPAITKVDVRPSKIEFGRWNTPVELTSLEDAKKHFEGDALEKLLEGSSYFGEGMEQSIDRWIAAPA